MTLTALYTAVRAEADRLLPGLRVRRRRGGVMVVGAWVLHVLSCGRAVRVDTPGWCEWPDWRVGLRDLALDTARADVVRLAMDRDDAVSTMHVAELRLAGAVARLDSLAGRAP